MLANFRAFLFQMTCMFDEAGEVPSHQAWLGSFGLLNTDDACMTLYASSSPQLHGMSSQVDMYTNM
jgi:hypothetical protein